MSANISKAVRKILDVLEPLSRDEAVRTLDAVDVVYDPLEAGREVTRTPKTQPKPQAKSGELDARILKTLKSSAEGMSPADLDAALGKSASGSQIRYRLRVMTDQGLITATGTTFSRRYLVANRSDAA